MEKEAFMVRRMLVHYHWAALLILPALLLLPGCGQSDSATPPPGLSDDVPELKVDTGLPTDTPASSTDAAQGAGKPAAPKGDK